MLPPAAATRLALGPARRARTTPAALGLLRALHSSTVARSVPLPLPRTTLPLARASSAAPPSTFFTPSSAAGLHSTAPAQLLRDPPPPGSTLPPPPSLWARSSVLRVLTRLCFSSVLGLVVLTGAILVHDSLTYGSHRVGTVDVHPLALKPERGGRKNLPVLAHDIGELEEGNGNGERKDKPRLVIVGGGWGVRP